MCFSFTIGITSNRVGSPRVDPPIISLCSVSWSRLLSILGPFFHPKINLDYDIVLKWKMSTFHLDESDWVCPWQKCIGIRTSAVKNEFSQTAPALKVREMKWDTFWLGKVSTYKKSCEPNIWNAHLKPFMKPRAVKDRWGLFCKLGPGLREAFKNRKREIYDQGERKGGSLRPPTPKPDPKHL